ncbi:zinc finger domain, LSD1 subclass domain-containing protein [Besnoitia besnoiti]|uniref:Zinc finger domain, LSD1 subclass domain-containing protein n=1 Tax=Besnoitia besnoiti TaxID=94643 RepID=A0A2A9MAH0_BESBE|nr:zinc finger domain, LSD1 subclass domain-containing protein [Besnoitia besnoiti]PFH32360.1 zinc finger domain, LSD1 subclass domain-containing protein [Besnoitia besnoiti]
MEVGAVAEEDGCEERPSSSRGRAEAPSSFRAGASLDACADGAAPASASSPACASPAQIRGPRNCGVDLEASARAASNGAESSASRERRTAGNSASGSAGDAAAQAEESREPEATGGSQNGSTREGGETGQRQGGTEEPGHATVESDVLYVGTDCFFLELPDGALACVAGLENLPPPPPVDETAAAGQAPPPLARIQCHSCLQLLEFDSRAQFVQCSSCLTLNAVQSQATSGLRGGRAMIVICGRCSTRNISCLGSLYVECWQCRTVCQVDYPVARGGRLLVPIAGRHSEGGLREGVAVESGSRRRRLLSRRSFHRPRISWLRSRRQGSAEASLARSASAEAAELAAGAAPGPSPRSPPSHRRMLGRPFSSFSSVRLSRHSFFSSRTPFLRTSLRQRATHPGRASGGSPVQANDGGHPSSESAHARREGGDANELARREGDTGEPQQAPAASDVSPGRVGDAPHWRATSTGFRVRASPRCVLRHRVGGGRSAPGGRHGSRLSPQPVAATQASSTPPDNLSSAAAEGVRPAWVSQGGGGSPHHPAMRPALQAARQASLTHCRQSEGVDLRNPTASGSPPQPAVSGAENLDGGRQGGVARERPDARVAAQGDGEGIRPPSDSGDFSRALTRSASRPASDSEAGVPVWSSSALAEVGARERDLRIVSGNGVSGRAATLDGPEGAEAFSRPHRSLVPPCLPSALSTQGSDSHAQACFHLTCNGQTPAQAWSSSC